MAELETQGAIATVLPSPYAPFEELSVPRQLLCIDGYEGFVFEYANESDRRAEADDAPPTQGADLDLLWGTIGWWATSNVLVLFHYEPTRPGPVVPMLDTVMGPQIGRTGFALGDPPDDIPLSEHCS